MRMPRGPTHRIPLHTAGRKPNETVNGVRVSELQRYINQLHLARKRCERRIEALGGQRHWVRPMTRTNAARW